MGFKTREKGKESDRAAVTCDGRLVHRRADEARNALSPTLAVAYRGGG